MNSVIDPRSLLQLEIPVTDIDRAKTFYEAVFGWRPSPAELHECIILEVPDGCPYGISLVPSQNSSNGMRQGVIPYFQATDPTTIIEKTVRYGGNVVKDAAPLGIYGVLHHLQDPDGNVIGIISQP